MSAKAAIVQPSIIMGGRLHVILNIVRCLNGLGIVPDVLTHRIKFDYEQLNTRYGMNVEVQFNEKRPLIPLPGEWHTARFNAGLRRNASTYDLLINTSNSLLFLPAKANILTYLFYPRKARIFADVVDLHDPDRRPARLFSWYKPYNAISRMLYGWSRPEPAHSIVCMTEFTREAFRQSYPEFASNTPVIPPPVPLREFRCTSSERPPAVVSVGRFDVAKGQLRQIRLAAQLPQLTFHIIGFVFDRNYYERCRTLISEMGLANVHLHPQASFEEMVSLLQSSRYFLHTTVNEPFGITAVQAIAAGCIPLVHDSGGQRETVPIERLRYQELGEVVDLIRELEREPAEQLAAMANDLQKHIEQYDEDVFAARMTPILKSCLGL